MARSESRCRHRPDCCLREPLRRKRDVAKEGDETGESGRVSRRDGADQSQRRKRLRAVETTGEAARCGTTKPKPAGPPEEPLVKGCCESGKIGARMPTSARTLLRFFGQFADVGIRAPEQYGLLQQAFVR